jgi:CO/xanthine dehydrogenase FAD-binding subunit
MSAIERYCAPRSLAEAAEVLRAADVTILAGGTDLMPQTQTGRVRFKPVLMNIRRVPELAGIEQDAGGFRIGALVTMTELLRSPLVRDRLGILWQSCDHFASDQLRNAATVGGNICNASPAGDTLVPLLVLEARVTLASKPDGAVLTRTLPLSEFLLAPGRTARRPGELLVDVRIPAPPQGFRGEFYKLGTRPALDISAISIGVGAVRSGRTLRDVRIAFGAVAPTAIRAPKTEAALEGRSCDAATLEAALAAADAEIRPISDVRASDWYRREMIRNILRRLLGHDGNS